MAALALAGCGSSAGSNDGSGDPSKITVYSTMIPAVQEKLAADFEERTGIEVDWTREQSSALTRRFHEETAAGKPVADVLTMNEEVYAVDNASMFEDLSDLEGMEAIPEEWRLTDQTFQPTFAPQKIAYSKEKFAGREDELPQDWSDLLDPRFKGGKILFADPRTNQELSSKHLYALAESEGEQFLADFAAQELTVVPSSTPGMEELAAGNGELLAYSYDMNLLAYEDAGAPIGLVGPFEPVVGLSFYTQIPKDAPNVEGARAWVEYLVSPEGQQIINDGVGVSPLGEDIPGSLTMPEAAVNPDPAEALAKLPDYLDLLGLE
ncbi:ABC transporter substrate-binding protein [Aeromicrobium phragmitis]|uniref:ABC transporter substrate-binding protein n=1 Tax=Aeromicrobium phragmitis TaxID=2478914 RepID=UPI001409164F|nr:extracellular solute-binding protein [Aeromicrobium phragmitis]